MTIYPRSELESVRVATHGGFHADEWRARGDVIDFSSNVNPFGASPRVREALASVPIERHPDPAASELRDTLGARLRLPREQIIVGNGSLELIRALAIAYVRTGDAALVIGPTFGEYRVAAQVMGARVDEIVAHERDDFRLDVDAVAARVALQRPRIAFICNPNNPTGAYLTRDQIVQLLAASSDTLWALDEAFVAFADQAWASFELLAQFENLVVIRSMTKDYAIPGLRLGYAAAQPDVIAALTKARAPWSVNSFAQAAGLAVLSDDEFLHGTLAKIRAATGELRAAITRRGWRVMPSAVHFFLAEAGNAGAFRASLARRGCIVRDCTSFGLPEFVRIATRRPEENTLLIRALEEIR
jgi:histidinol-phosphate aminotransferase